MKKLLFCALMAIATGGCATLKGSLAYDGPVSDTPIMTFDVRRSIDMCGVYGQSRCLATHAALVVTNPSEFPLNVTVDCDDLYTFYKDVVIPARSSQYFLVDASTKRCWLQDRKFVR